MGLQPRRDVPWQGREALKAMLTTPNIFANVPEVFADLIPSWDWLEPLILDVLTLHPYAWEEGRCLCLPEGQTMRHPEWRRHIVNEITRRGKQALRGTR